MLYYNLNLFMCQLNMDMLRAIITSILLLTSSTCYAEWSDWQDHDKALFVASSVAMTADWATTRSYARNWSAYPGTRETNPILGSYPSTTKVDVYFVVLLVSNYYITDLLPDNAVRSIYLTVRTYDHASAARHNLSLGWQLRF